MKVISVGTPYSLKMLPGCPCRRCWMPFGHRHRRRQLPPSLRTLLDDVTQNKGLVSAIQAAPFLLFWRAVEWVSLPGSYLVLTSLLACLVLCLAICCSHCKHLSWEFWQISGTLFPSQTAVNRGFRISAASSRSTLKSLAFSLSCLEAFPFFKTLMAETVSCFSGGTVLV